METADRPCLSQKVRDHAIGYPNLAVFKSSSDSFALYRRFGYLQSRLLLEKQDDLRILEQRLEDYDRADISTSYTRALAEDVLLPRQTLLAEIELAFNAYGMLPADLSPLSGFSDRSDVDDRCE